MKSLTLRAGISKTLTHQFMVGAPTSFTRLASNAESSDLEVAKPCFAVGDRVGLCVSSGKCPPLYQKGCTTVVATADNRLTLSGVAIGPDSTGSLYKVPGLRGMWLSLTLTPSASMLRLSSPVVTQAGSALVIVCGETHLAPGDRVSLAGVVDTATVLATHCFTMESGGVGLMLTLSQPARRSVGTQEYQALTIHPHSPITVAGARARTSAGAGSCGALQIHISRETASKVAAWGSGLVGTWRLALNNGWSTSAPWTSDLLQEGALHIG